ncbi:hypothetical protein ACFLX7_02760 [Chloroflexota bacterium]
MNDMTAESRQKKEHFDELAEIADLLLEDGLDQIKETENDSSSPHEDSYAIVTENDEPKGITRDEISYSLEGNMDVARTLYDPELWSGFESHMEAESAEVEAKGLTGLASADPLQLVELLKMVAQRRAFRSNCPICKDW